MLRNCSAQDRNGHIWPILAVKMISKCSHTHVCCAFSIIFITKLDSSLPVCASLAWVLNSYNATLKANKQVAKLWMDDLNFFKVYNSVKLIVATQLEYPQVIKIIFCFLTFIPALCFANTFNGAPGNPSTAEADIRFDIAKIASISGLQDMIINNIDPHNAQLPTTTLAGVCLYSSTGKVSILAESIDTTIDYQQQLATMVSQDNYTTHFRLQLDQRDLLNNAINTFDANATFKDCSNNAYKYPITVTLNEIPQRAGTYKATIRLTVTAVDF